MKSLNFKILAAGMMLTACGAKSPELNNSLGVSESQDSGIINGTNVGSTDLESKSTVGIYLKKENKVSAFCTGTLISSNIILTAAHCFADFAAEANTTVEELRKTSLIGFGTKAATSLNETQVSFSVIEKVAIHPEYKVNSVATAKTDPMKDVALLKISGRAPSGFTTALIPTSDAPMAGNLVSIAGYGLTRVGLFVASEAKQMMKVTLPVGDANFSETQFSDKVIQGKSSCMGDSGGPVYMRTGSADRLAVVGIVSWGDGGCSKIGVYTKTSKFRSWISQTAKALTVSE